MASAWISVGPIQPQSTYLNGPGKHEGKFVFPFGYCAVLTQISEEQLTNHPGGNLRAVLTAQHVVTADEFEAWGAFTGAQLKQRLTDFFSPKWEFPRLHAEQRAALRVIIHPEVLVPPTPAELAQVTAFAQRLIPADTQTVRSLDLEQERMARSIGTGHRLLFGVAGSGKTIVLAGRAKFLSEGLPNGRILVLCYNVTFKSYLAAILKDCANVDVYSFHGWGVRNGVRAARNEAAESFGERLLSVLSQGKGDSGAYDAVLIDEAQDFDPSWFKCAIAAMKEPRGGDLLIVGDRNQTNYTRGRVSWSALGITAKGRSRILRTNYRNTRNILAAARTFADDSTDDDGIAATSCDPTQARRDGLFAPLLLARKSRGEELDAIESLVKGLLAGQVKDYVFPALAPSEIGLLYREKTDALELLLEKLRVMAPVVWLSGPQTSNGPDPRQQVLAPGVKVQTIHSSKGLQYRAVILIFADQLGSRGEEENDQRLLYVAMTRPEDFLAITCTTGAGRPSAVFQRLLSSESLLRE